MIHDGRVRSGRSPTVEARSGPRPSPQVGSPHQYSLGVVIALHLLPGAALTAFIVVATALGLESALALFLGIPLVIVPLELGYLLVRAKRTIGARSLSGVLPYREKLPMRKYLVLGSGAYAWFVVMLVVSLALLDEWIAHTFLFWLPDSILGFATIEAGGDDMSPLALAALMGIVFVFNGIVDPVVEELYFRERLLPSIARYGRWAPEFNAALFSVYHLWTPWQNPARFLGLLPWIDSAWRTRSVYLAIAIHIAANITFVLLSAALLAG